MRPRVSLSLPNYEGMLCCKPLAKSDLHAPAWYRGRRTSFQGLKYAWVGKVQRGQFIIRKAGTGLIP